MLELLADTNAVNLCDDFRLQLEKYYDTEQVEYYLQVAKNTRINHYYDCDGKYLGVPPTQLEIRGGKLYIVGNPRPYDVFGSVLSIVGSASKLEYAVLTAEGEIFISNNCYEPISVDSTTPVIKIEYIGDDLTMTLQSGKVVKYQRPPFVYSYALNPMDHVPAGARNFGLL